jgi:predicted RNA methylase
MTTALSPAAAEALRRATVTASSVKLNSGQLDRKVYEEVNKVLTRIGGGGKWHRGSQSHLFPYDPTIELNGLLFANQMPIDKDKEASFFRTPDDLADSMAETVRLSPELRVLEPSAGDGQIVRAIYRRQPHSDVDCVEVDERRVEYLRALGFRVYRQPFEEFASQREATYDAVLMNPPFTVPGDRLAWLTHVELAVRLLRPGGQLVAIVPAGFLFRTGARFEALREAVGDDYTELPRDMFKEAGTAISTVMIQLQAPAGSHPAEVQQPLFAQR